MNSNVNPQGLTNIYWKTFQNSGKIDDFMRYMNSKKSKNSYEVKDDLIVERPFH